MNSYPNLFAPIQINSVEFKNRLVMAPMATRYATYGGYVTERMIQYYKERAEGGTGLITIEATTVSVEGAGWPNNLAVYSDAHVDGLKKLVDAIHSGGAKAALEIFHTGRRALSPVIFQQPVAPSAVPAPKAEVPRELTVPEIKNLVDKFVQAARRAKEAGFDVVNIHMAHGYLIQQFLSPLSNRRNDEYGGDTAGRCKFAVEVLKGVRSELGPDFPIFCRLTVDEGVEAGLNLQESQIIAGILVNEGADLIDVSAGGPERPQLTVQPMSMPRGCLIHLGEGIKKAIEKPVSIVGRINTPDMAENILANGQADMIITGRPLLADPEFPEKAKSGRSEEIRTCIGCNHGCSNRLGSGMEVSCLVNPRVGRESMLTVQNTTSPREILVVGGGPSGMEAAATAAERGHRVTLIEKKAKLGGQCSLAGTLPHKKEFLTYIDYQKGRLERAGVKVLLETPFNEGIIEDYKPEVIIEATGAEPAVPPIPGLEQAEVHQSWDLIEKGINDHWKKVLIIGGGEVGCETAEFLAEQGLSVVVVEMLPKIAEKMNARDRELLLSRVKSLPIDMLTDVTINEIRGDTVELDHGGLQLTFTEIDAVILAGGSQPVNLELPKDAGITCHRAGDCCSPLRMFDAVHQGFTVGSKI